MGNIVLFVVIFVAKRKQNYKISLIKYLTKYKNYHFSSGTSKMYRRVVHCLLLWCDLCLCC
uniref:Uncharacterized protein n=1 Tax=Oryza brachyantha TaxID=4533 RepID=J3N210_ORYBR